MSVSPTEELEISSTAEVTTGANAESPAAVTTEGAKAESPTAEGVKESLVDRVQNALKQQSEGKSPAPVVKEGKDPTIKASEGEPQAPVEDDDRPFTQDEINRLHSKTRKQFNRLLSNVNRLESDVKAAQDEVAAAKSVAGKYENLTGFLKEHDIPADDANAAFELLRDIRRNPMAALERLTPLVQQLQKITGVAMPDDLQQQIRVGAITPEYAAEVSRLRAAQAQQQAEIQRQEERSKRDQQSQNEARIQGIDKGIRDWETRIASSDPDYQKLRSDFQDEIELSLVRAQRENRIPLDPAAVVQFAEDCLKRVKARATRYSPPMTEIRHVQGSGGAAVQTAKPKSSLEAAMAALNR